MEKPKNYAYYSTKKNNVPFKDWPQECKDYKNWKRDILHHPEWKDLTLDEIKEKKKEIKRQRGVNAAALMRKKYSEKTEEEKKVINEKKGNAWKDLTDKERKEKSEEMRKRSQDFWDGMSDKQRKEFSKYRWDLKSDEEKEVIINRFMQGSIEYRKNMSKEEIDKQIQKMNEARLRKLEEDDQFREEQFRLLRKHNQDYFDSLTPDELQEHNKNMHERRKEEWVKKWNNDKDFREKQIEFLTSISKLGAQAIKRKWEEDRQFRDEQIKMLNEIRLNYLNNIPAEEKYRLLKHNKLNDKFENRFNESILNLSFYYIGEYRVGDSNEYKFWDYGIFDKSTDKLVMVVDLDGRFYHADTCDYNGLHSREEQDEKRGILTPENIKIQIIDENNFNVCFKEMIQSLMMNYDLYISHMFDLYRSIEFPFPNYTNDELIRSYKQLKRMNPDNKYLDLSIRNREGDRIISNFHNSIYHANRKGKPSPYDAWYNDELLRKCIENRILYRSLSNPNKILQGFNVSKIAPKVSVFSAGRAKLLIHKYLNEYDEIFDPFSGFSGRMLGAMSMSKKYIGQDISHIHINESMKIIEFLKIAKVHFPDLIEPYMECKDVLQSSGEYECLFTCPPYGDKEQWWKYKSDTRSCDDWIDICLKNFKCKRYLFIVDYTEKYKDYIVDEIINRSHLNNNNEYIIMINII